MKKLLFVTQVMDQHDSVLGAYHEWVTELASYMDSITVICLYEGTHSLPENVSVFSLGKEQGRVPAYRYAARFLLLAWRLKNRYDSVFVHMNQEYILIAGPLWKLLGKRIYMWRNHYAGSWLTDIAASFCIKVFCTSRHSYTAKYRNTQFMPVGVEITEEKPDVVRAPRSILFLARIAPSKRLDLFIEALGLLQRQGVAFTASVYGSPLPEHQSYHDGLIQQTKEMGLEGRIVFHPGISHKETPAVFAAHEIFVNCSPSGMFDKTLFEAAAADCLVLATSDDFARETDERLRFTTVGELADRLTCLLHEGPETLLELRQVLKKATEAHSRTALMAALSNALSG